MRVDRKTAFSRVDLVVVLACLSVWFGIVAAKLAAAEPVSEREACQNNLRELGKAYSAWAKDHGDKLPWMLTRADGGSQGMAAGGNAWVQAAWLSNHLESPKFLACPSDETRLATEWSRRGSGGFWHQDFRNNALSYFVGLDMTEQSPRALLSGDHNIQVSVRAQHCDLAQVRTAVSLRPGDENLSWLDGQVHGEQGNVLFFDGSVKSLSGEQLRTAAGETEAHHADNHSLWPR